METRKHIFQMYFLKCENIPTLAGLVGARLEHINRTTEIPLSVFFPSPHFTHCGPLPRLVHAAEAPGSPVRLHRHNTANLNTKAKFNKAQH